MEVKCVAIIIKREQDYLPPSHYYYYYYYYYQRPRELYSPEEGMDTAMMMTP